MIDRTWVFDAKFSGYAVRIMQLRVYMSTIWSDPFVANRLRAASSM